MTIKTNLTEALINSTKEYTLFIYTFESVRVEVVFYRAYIRSYEGYDIETNELKYKHI